MANSNIEAFITAYGSRILPQQRELLRAAADYFDSDPGGNHYYLDSNGNPVQATANITVTIGSPGSTGSTGIGNQSLTFPAPGGTALVNVPVSGIPGWEDSTFMTYDSEMGVVHEVNHAILNLLGNGSSELNIAILAYVANPIISAATVNGVINYIQVAQDLINLLVSLPSATKLSIARLNQQGYATSYENIFNQNRNFYN